MSEKAPKSDQAELSSRKTILERLRAKRRLLALGATALSALSIGLGVIKTEAAALGLEKPAATYSFKTGEKLDYKSWQDFKIKSVPHIEPDPVVKQIIIKRDPFFNELGLDPQRIEDERVFSHWVGAQLDSEAIKDSFNKPAADMNAKDLVEASALITANNLKYSWDTDANAKAAKQPMDKILMEHLPSECETYTATQQAIFYEFKRMFPDKLANTYLIENYIEATEVMHYVNAVVQVESPKDISVAIIDPTGKDRGWVHGQVLHTVKQAENFSTLLEGMHDRGVLD